MWKLRSISWLGFRMTPKVKNLEYLSVIARKRGEVTRFSGRGKVERKSVSWRFCFLFTFYSSLTQYFKVKPWGYLTKFYTQLGGGGSALRSNPYPLNTLSYTIFDRNVTFVYLLWTMCSFSLAMGLQWYPFHIRQRAVSLFSVVPRAKRPRHANGNLKKKRDCSQSTFTYLIWNFAFLTWLSCINSSHNQNVFPTISQP